MEQTQTTVDYSELNKGPLQEFARLNLNRPIEEMSLSDVDSLKHWLHAIENRMLSQYPDVQVFILQEAVEL